MKLSELTTRRHVALEVCQVFFSNELLAIFDLDGPSRSGEVSPSLRRSSSSIWFVSLEGLGFPSSSAS